MFVLYIVASPSIADNLVQTSYFATTQCKASWRFVASVSNKFAYLDRIKSAKTAKTQGLKRQNMNENVAKPNKLYVSCFSNYSINKFGVSTLAYFRFIFLLLSFGCSFFVFYGSYLPFSINRVQSMSENFSA